MSDPKSDTNEPEEKLRMPSEFQRKTFWAALTAVCIVTIAAISVGAIVLGGKVLAYLQPILVPIAVAGILAYLLEPIITWLRRKTRWKQKWCMLLVFVAFLVAIVLLIIAVVVPSVRQGQQFLADWDRYQIQMTEVARDTLDDFQKRFDNPALREYTQKYYDRGLDWITQEAPDLGQKVGSWTLGRLRGAFGFLGYLLGLVLVPIYLFFFLKEGHNIKRKWSDFLPLRASNFKDEVVSTLQEINQYLVSFFRGQMIVSIIDGALVAVALTLLGLPHALLIGVFLAILGLIPYIGNLLVMIPAVLIAIAHFGDREDIYRPLDSDIETGQVKYVQLAGYSKPERKYVAKVEAITRVMVKDDSGKMVEGQVPYIEPGKESAAEVTNVDGEEVLKTEGAELASGIPAEVGRVMIVKMPNGLEQKRTIEAVIKSEKRVEVMQNAWSYLPNMWFYPLIVIAIFVILQQINGLVTAPMIVGDSVGLHPLNVIFSVLFWSFLLGGLLGALLAIPLTASLKVLFRRYIWAQRIEPRVTSAPVAATEDAE